MSILRLALTSLLLTVAASAPAPSARQDRAGDGVDQGRVVVVLSAVDKEGRPVEGLKPEDLRVTVEGQEQKLLSLSQKKDEPLRLVVVLDASASQERVLPWAREVSARLVAALVRPGVDEAAVISFSGDPKLVQDLTGDPGALRRAFAAVEFVPPVGYVSGGVIVGALPPNASAMRSGTTAIWDSLVYACDQVFAHAGPGRRAVVLFTDGIDTTSSTKSDKAVERLARDGVAVYSVGFADTYAFDEVDRGKLRKVSERTGGLAVFPRNEKDIPAAFLRVGNGLLSAYALVFVPRPPKGGGKASKLRVEVVNPELRKRGLELAYPQALYDGPSPVRR